MWTGCLLITLLLCLTVPADSSVIPKTSDHDDVTLTATPDVMFQGLTKDLHLNCSYLQDPGSDVSVLISLILSKTTAQGSVMELAAVTLSSRDSASVKESLGAKVTGLLPATGAAYISYVWTYPSTEVVGQYQCEMRGMDYFGRVIVANDIANVTEKSNEHDLYHDAILDRLSEMQVAIDSQKQVNVEQALTLEENRVDLDNKQTQLDDQNKILNDISTRINESQSALMSASFSYQGHTYHLSHRMWVNVRAFDSLCRLYGGYLAEITDQGEFDFIQDFFRKNPVSEHVYIGGTDEGHTGTWKFTRSGETLTFLPWAAGQPNFPGSQDCLMLWPSHDWLFADYPCQHNEWNRVMCEVPH